MGGGRTQAAIGSPRNVTAFNCFVSGTIEDSMGDIMAKAAESAETMRLGGGIGYDFSTLRPRGDLIVSLDSKSSGPVSFMEIFDAVCATISSAGHRRGAQMGVLRVDHPDIEEFVRAKQNTDHLTRFNISVGITDEFMEAVKNDDMFDLRFDGRIYKQVRATALWDEIMRATWEWAEPGVLFIDRINEMNNLSYCETITATNPCGEQPLPPYGACLLGSFNLTKYIMEDADGQRIFDYTQFKADIPEVVRAMDNIHDSTTFPLEEQARESYDKRRMGLGFTGVANAGEALGLPYASPEFLSWLEGVLEILRDECYNASVDLAKEKGAFPLFDAEKYLATPFIKTLPDRIRRRIKKYGIRNSHLLSIAPTGTISLSADNCSGGIEPVFALETTRTIQKWDGPVVVDVPDYAYRKWEVKGKTSDQCTPQEHLSVLALAQKYIDSSCSKTINLSGDEDWGDFKQIYIDAFDLGCKGCTTFNPKGKRFGILNKKEEGPEDEGAKACYINKETGQKECS
jgi:ribonucleoside-diphosphate reductase alpha chain